MWEAFWPLKGMKMQPTKKMSIGKLILAAVATAGAAMSATGDAREYTVSPDAVYGTPTATIITATVADSMQATEIEFTPRPGVGTSAGAENVGRLTIGSHGAGAAPEGYVLAPCEDGAKYEIAVDGRKADGAGLEMRDTAGTTIEPRHAIQANTGGTTPVDVMGTTPGSQAHTRHAW